MYIYVSVFFMILIYFYIFLFFSFNVSLYDFIVPVRPLCVIFVPLCSSSQFIHCVISKDAPVSDTTILLCNCDIIVSFIMLYVD